MKSVCARRERGAALILFATILVLGVAWFTIGALGKAAPTSVDREIKTGPVLNAGKQALLSYLVQYAARASTTEPGQMPCPESLASIGGANEGRASTSCSNATISIGRLPWRTLGIDQLRDGDGEPLWYVLSPGFRSAPINFATIGQLTYNGALNAAVALIIAPGKPLNTSSDPAAPPAECSKVNQQVSNRNTASLNPANFFECGNASGSYANPGTSQWSNDRVVSITTAEWLDAITPAIADRLQREVAAALGNWDQDELAATGKSWGATHGLPYLPFASTWGNPTTNNYRGNQDRLEGLAPIEAAYCSNKWGNDTVSVSSAMNSLGCSNPSGTTYRRCRFERKNATTPVSAQITVRTDKVALAFCGTIGATDLTITLGGTATMSMALPNNTSDATATIDVSWPTSLPVTTQVEVQIPHLVAAAVLSNSRVTWFLNNNWHQYTYYAIAPSATASPVLTCVSTGDAGCLTITGLPASSGDSWNKRLALVLSGKPLSTLTQPSSSRSNYFESGNATTGDRIFESKAPSTTFNDRVAACPFKYVPASGSPMIVCN